MSAKSVDAASGGRLVEESVHLLRRAPAAALAIYYAGTVPFALGLLYFWGNATWFRPPAAELAGGAIGLAVLFVAMKTLQAEFCAHLLALRLGEPAPAWNWRRLGRVARAQWRLQPWALLATVAALVLTLPFGWVYAYAQNVSVLGAEEQLHEEAVKQAKLWPGQNHFGLLLISGVAVTAWANLASAIIALPWLANRLLGIENIFGFSGFWYLNTTFLAAVTAVAWLAIDPLVKAFYVLRVFYGRSRRTGDDVRVELRLARAGPALGWMLAAVALYCAAPHAARAATTAAPAPAPTRVQAAELDRSIERVLDEPEFRWRLHPIETKATTASADGPIARLLRPCAEFVLRLPRAMWRGFRKFLDWLGRRMTDDEAAPEKHSGGVAPIFLQGVLYLFIGAVVVLLLWIVFKLAGSARQSGAAVVAARAVAAPAPDLQDENVQAAQLPADGWLALAREQIARGEWRLALRALHLATLARLGAQGLIALAKFKTNLDYERELRRRAVTQSDLPAKFAAQRRAFEAVWYGRTEANEVGVRAWLTELERPVA